MAYKNRYTKNIPEREPEYKTAARFGEMYLKDNMTAKQISDETGYSINTVKHYLSEYGYRKK